MCTGAGDDGDIVLIHLKRHLRLTRRRTERDDAHVRVKHDARRGIHQRAGGFAQMHIEIVAISCRKRLHITPDHWHTFGVHRMLWGGRALLRNV